MTDVADRCRAIRPSVREHPYTQADGEDEDARRIRMHATYHHTQFYAIYVFNSHTRLADAELLSPRAPAQNGLTKL